MEKERILAPYGDVNIPMLKEFSEAKGISGHEAGASRCMKKWLEGYADTFEYDNLGSLLATKKGTKSEKGPKIALFGHLDEVGFYVRSIEESGYIKVAQAGGFWPHVLMAQEVMLTTREGKE